MSELLRAALRQSSSSFAHIERLIAKGHARDALAIAHNAAEAIDALLGDEATERNDLARVIPIHPKEPGRA